MTGGSYGGQIQFAAAGYEHAARAPTGSTRSSR